jgi:hypothetical protein
MISFIELWAEIAQASTHRKNAYETSVIALHDVAEIRFKRARGKSP